MKFEIYREAVKRTVKDLGTKDNLSHMALGFASELSELEDCLINDEVDRVNLAEELGDKLWYAANWANFMLISELEHNTIFDETINFIFKPSSYSRIIIYGGRLADIAKRLLAYRQSPEDQQKQRREKALEKGKIFETNNEMWYRYITAIHAMCLVHNLDIEIVMAANIAKLAKRYPENFTNDDAITRSLNDERAVLESFYKGE